MSWGVCMVFIYKVNDYMVCVLFLLLDLFFLFVF